MFLRFHSKDDNEDVLINTDDVSYIINGKEGVCFKMKSIADDFDETKHQVSIVVKEDFDYVFKMMSFYVGAK